MTDPSLDGERVRELLHELGARLAVRGIEGRMFLVGGAAMALAFSRRRITRDLGAVFEPKREIYDEAGAMARERGLPDNWLNDAARQETDGDDLRLLAAELGISTPQQALDLVERFYAPTRLSGEDPAPLGRSADSRRVMKIHAVTINSRVSSTAVWADALICATNLWVMSAREVALRRPCSRRRRETDWMVSAPGDTLMPCDCTTKRSASGAWRSTFRISSMPTRFAPLPAADEHPPASECPLLRWWTRPTPGGPRMAVDIALSAIVRP